MHALVLVWAGKPNLGMENNLEDQEWTQARLHEWVFPRVEFHPGGLCTGWMESRTLWKRWGGPACKSKHRERTKMKLRKSMKTRRQRWSSLGWLKCSLPTEVHPVKAMIFPVVMHGCESWTIKKAECRRIDAFELWCWRRLLRVPWTARRSN